MLLFAFGVWLAQLFGYPPGVPTGPLPARPAPPATGAYLGAWVNTVGPNNGHGAEESETETLEAGMGRPFAIHLHYYNFNTANSNTPNNLTVGNLAADPTIQKDIFYHRMPFVTWPCAAPLLSYYTGGSNGHVGQLDDQIDAAAAALKSLNVPVGFRLFFEFNDCLVSTSCANGYNPNCFPQGANVTNTIKGNEFKAAWNYIYNRFQSQGATNVAFIWDPSGPPGDVSANNLQYYLPLPAYVDWVGFDCYDKLQYGFVNVVSRFYNWFTSTYPTYGKPMILEETGELNNNGSSQTCDASSYPPPNGTTPCTQAQYFSDISANIATTYPLIKAVVYFDASTSYNWLFDGTEPAPGTPATGGIAALDTLAGTSYFSPMGY